jgi:hypothetical protein
LIISSGGATKVTVILSIAPARRKEDESMRATLMLSTLFAVSLTAGMALADKPVDKLRHHGDMIDKVYKHGDKVAPQASQGAAASTPQTKSHVDRGASRINCSDTGADCSRSSAPVPAAKGDATGPTTVGDHPARLPAFLDKVMGSDKTNFNEADVDQGMSRRAVNRAWSHGTTASQSQRPGAASAVVPLSRQQQHARGDQQASADRMSCNEADECMMSSKAVKKSWGYESIKKGTWKGPPAAAPSPAAVAVAAMKGRGGTATVHQGDPARKAEAVRNEQAQDHNH